MLPQRKTTAVRFGMMLLLLGTIVPAAGAEGIELISRAPAPLAPQTTGGLAVFYGEEERPIWSADGRYVVFLSEATNVVPGQIDTPFSSDVFLHDRVTGTTRLVSHAAGSPVRAGSGGADQPALSADGRYVAFASSSADLVAGVEDLATSYHVYLWDRETGQTTLVSRRAGGEEGADNVSLNPSISADGGVVVFASAASDLVPGVTVSGSPDLHVYLYERVSGAVSLVSRSAASASRSGNGSSFKATVSADGRFVTYVSRATDLVAGQNDANGTDLDVFLFDRLTGATALASHVAGSALTTSDRESDNPSLSADGRYVAFDSAGVPGANSRPDAFLYDRLSGTVILVSLGGGYRPEVSEDGSTVVYFTSDPRFHVDSRIAAYDVLTGSRGLVSQADRGATDFSISADGRIVAFTNGPRGAATNLFLHDRSTGATVLASHAAGSPTRPGNGESFLPALSADGSWLAYGSFASDLVARVRDGAGSGDLFLYQRATGTNRLVTLHPPGRASRTPGGESETPSLSADGRYVAFTSSAALVPGVTVFGHFNVYLHDRVTGQTVLVSRSSRSSLVNGNEDSEAPRISRDGNVVAFVSLATDLVPGQEDRPGTYDVFLWNRQTRATVLVSHAHASRTRAGTGEAFLGDVSKDGTFVVFESTARDLVARRDTGESLDVFVWDRRTGATTRVSRPSPAGSGDSSFSSMSPDGAFIAFDSSGSRRGAFLYERRTGRTSLLSQGGRQPLISADGRWAAFLTLDQEARPDHAVTVLDRATGSVLEILRSDRALSLIQGMSDDGRWLLFSGDETGLVLFDRVSRELRLVSHVSGNSNLSPDGRWVAFQSDAPPLLPDGSPQVSNVFLYDRTTREATLVSRSIVNPPQGGGSHSSQPVVVNGGLVAFASQASDLVPRDFNASSDVFVYVPESP